MILAPDTSCFPCRARAVDNIKVEGASALVLHLVNVILLLDLVPWLGRLLLGHDVKLILVYVLDETSIAETHVVGRMRVVDLGDLAVVVDAIRELAAHTSALLELALLDFHRGDGSFGSEPGWPLVGGVVHQARG